MDQARRLRSIVSGVVAPQPVPVDRSERLVRVIAVTSGKGGVGKTTIAVNLALLLQGRGKRVLIVDADLGLANVDVMLGIETPRHLGHALLPSFAASDVAVEGPGGIMVISGGSGLRELAGASTHDRSVLLSKLEDYHREFDYVVVDTSPGIGDHVMDFLEVANEMLLVTTPEPTSLRDCYAAAKTLHHRLPNTDPFVVVNMASGTSDAERSLAVLNGVSARFLGRSYHRWGYIENDPIVGRTIEQRKPLVTSYPRSSASVSLHRLTRVLLEPEAATIVPEESYVVR